MPKFRWRRRTRWPSGFATSVACLTESIFTLATNNFWFVQFLEEDLRTAFCGNLTYSNLDEIRELLRRFNVSVDQGGEEFEAGIRRWSIGACFVTLSPRQYAALKTSFQGKGPENS